MIKNSQIHFNIDTETFLYIKEQAEKEGFSVSEFCRRKIKENPKLDNIKYMIQRIYDIIVDGE